MTIHIPVKFLLFVLYTCAVLGGAFGISYAVFEWRDDDAVSESTIEQLEVGLDVLSDSLNRRIDNTNIQVSGLRGDSSACHDALLGIDTIILQALVEGPSTALGLQVDEALLDYRVSCQ